MCQPLGKEKKEKQQENGEPETIKHGEMPTSQTLPFALDWGEAFQLSFHHLNPHPTDFNIHRMTMLGNIGSNNQPFEISI